MSQTMIHIKAEREVKETAQAIAKDMGLTLSAVIEGSLRNFIRTREIVFSTTPRMTPELEEIIKKAEADRVKGLNFSPVFTDADSALAFLSKKPK
jgi:addiction module RelB/DinJ family antitoxin